MPQKRHTVDQIVAKLRKADIELGKGKKAPEVRQVARIHLTDLFQLAAEVWWYEA